MPWSFYLFIDEDSSFVSCFSFIFPCLFFLLHHFVLSPGGCGKIHWPNRMCSSDASCPRYPNAACSFLHTKQKKYIIMNSDGTIKGIKKIGFKTVLNEGKK